MKPSTLVSLVLLAAALALLLGLEYMRYLGVARLGQVRALQETAAQRVLYYRSDADHEPSLFLTGAERSVRIISHQLSPMSAYDPEQSYRYGYTVKLVDQDANLLWSTQVFEHSRQTKHKLGPSGWDYEAAYLEGRSAQVSDPRSTVITLPAPLPLGATLDIAPVDPTQAPLAVRAYGLAHKEGTQPGWSEAAHDQLLSSLTKTPPLGRAVAQSSAQRLVARDASKGGASLLPIFVRPLMTQPSKAQAPRQLWLAGPWQRVILAKGPGKLEVQLQENLDSHHQECRQGFLELQTRALSGKLDHRYAPLGMQMLDGLSRCVSAKILIELEDELQDLRFRWVPQEGMVAPSDGDLGRGFSLRVWGHGDVVQLLDYQGFQALAPGQELRRSFVIKTQLHRLEPGSSLGYLVNPRLARGQSLRVQLRSLGQQDAPVTVVARFLDANGQMLRQFTHHLEAIFDPLAWAKVSGEHALGLREVSQPLTWDLRVPKSARRVELTSPDPLLLKLSARIAKSPESPAWKEPFASLLVDGQRWSFAPKAQQSWVSLRPDAQTQSPKVQLAVQTSLQPDQTRRSRRRSTLWASLAPHGRTLRHSVLESTGLGKTSARDRCSGCWFEVPAGRKVAFRGPRSLRESVQMIYEQQGGGDKTQCSFRIDGRPREFPCPVHRVQTRVPEIGAGRHRFSWKSNAPGARLWLNRPLRPRGRKARAFKKRTLHEFGQQALPIRFTIGKETGQHPKLRLIAYLSSKTGCERPSKLSFDVALQRDSDPALKKSLRAAKLPKSRSLVFLDDDRRGIFDLYRAELELGSWATPGEYMLELQRAHNGKGGASASCSQFWIRAIISE